MGKILIFYKYGGAGILKHFQSPLW